MQQPLIFTVEASAGSGKTYCLANRFIELLDEDQLNTILAITFTNKAALEMKERILLFIKQAALDKNSDAKTRQKALRTMDAILRNYNFFQVQTIDSFINSILYGCAFRLGLSVNFRTKELYSDYLAYSLDKLIDEAADDKKVLALLGNFLRQYLYIENKSGWFPKQNMLIVLNELFSKSNKYSAPFTRNDTDIKDIILYKRDVLKLIAALKLQLPAKTNAAFVKSLAGFLQKNEDVFDIDDVSEYFKHEDFPLTKGAELPAEVKKLWSDIRKGLSRLCELESISAFNYYIEIFDRSLEILNGLSGKDDVLFLESLNKQARLLFDEQGLSLPELYWRLATVFKHFLMDEFQDTSRLQWENIFPMVEEAVSKGGTLFYVGDRKQAIYRFRAGDATLMDSVKQGFKGFGVKEEFLVKNYRSQKAIVEFNNAIFSEENLKGFGIDDILGVFKGSSQTYSPEKDSGFVKVDFTEHEEEVKQLLLDTIEDVRKRFALRDIAVLARTNDDVQLFTSWLLESNIPVESEKTLNIRENAYIKELISLLKFLNSPIDNISFASFILGDIFLSCSGLKREQAQEFIFRHRRAAKDDAVHLYREFRKEFPKLWQELFEEFFKSVGFVPLYEFVITILARFRALEFFAQYQGFFMKFLEIINQQEADDNFGISGFLEYFQAAPQEKLYVEAVGGDSLKVLTIHKAKGLEFEVVIVPSLEINAKVDNQAVVETENGLGLVRLKKRYTVFSNELNRIYAGEYKKSLIDELDSIYVALTRPKSELYVFVPARSQQGNNMARLLFKEPGFQSGVKAGPVKREEKEAPAIEIPPSEYKNWIGLLKDEFSDESLLLSRDKVLSGKAMHYILSFAGNIKGMDIDVLVREAVVKAGFEFPFIEDFTVYEEGARRLLGDKRFKKYFMPEGADVYTEKEVVNEYGDTKRIDRLIVDKKEVIVIDYKSAREDALDYRGQVAGYMNIVKQIYPKHKVTGLLIYLDDLTTEEIDG